VAAWSWSWSLWLSASALDFGLAAILGYRSLCSWLPRAAAAGCRAQHIIVMAGKYCSKIFGGKPNYLAGRIFGANAAT